MPEAKEHVKVERENKTLATITFQNFFRLYDKLFTEANMNGIPEGSDYKDYLNPESVTVRTGCKLEESLKDAKPGEKFQFVRTGFFTPDSKNPGVYNAVKMA